MTTVDDGLPPIAAQRLTAFLGEWQVDGSLTAEQVPVAVTGNWRFERVVEGWGVLGAMDTEIEGMGAFGERELIGFRCSRGENPSFQHEQVHYPRSPRRLDR